MINVDDLKDEILKKEHRYSLACEKPIWDKIKDFKEKWGEERTAEVIRRLIDTGLPIADAKLRSKKK